VRAFETVFAQDYAADDTEILVIDGLSTDRTSQIVAELAARDSNLRLLTNPQRLQRFGLNLGIRVACRSYIAFVDADDFWLPQKLQLQMELFSRHPDLAWVYSEAVSLKMKPARNYIR
jgi:teichuronic acid biosynthesis glycosyltransferase TuaG